MNTALIMTAVQQGATVANYVEVTELHKDANGKLYGARVHDRLTGKQWNVRAQVSTSLIFSCLVALSDYKNLGYHQRNRSVH